METKKHDAATAHNLARSIVRRLREAGHEALFAGGCVRDTLRGVEAADIDIATSALPEQVQALFSRTVAVGAQFGVIVVILDGQPFEVATFRADGEYGDGRRPQSVRFTDAREDAIRRDFTINGMFLDPIENQVIDYVGGQEDLQRGVIRAIGDPQLRFEEDRLRLLRAVRFATVLGFKLETATWDAVCRNADGIHRVSAERIRVELVKTLMHPSRLRGFDLLDASGLLTAIIPEFAALKGCDQPPEFHPEGDVFVHTRMMLEMLPEKVSVPLLFAVLLHDIGKPATRTMDPAEGRIRFNGHERVGAEMTEQIMEGLRFSRVEIDQTVEAVRCHMMFKDVQQMRTSKLKRFMARPTFEDELELHRVDCSSSHGMLDNHRFLREQREAFASEPLIPPPLVGGHDLLQLGWKAGPQIGNMLEQIQNWQLEGLVHTKEEALAMLKASLEENRDTHTTD